MAPRPGLRERKKQRTKETLEETGLALFAERGFEGATVADIAEAADVSTRTVFRYFDSKDQLLFADHERRTAALGEALRGAGELTVNSLCDAVLDFFSVDVPRSADRIRLQLRVARDHWPARALMFQH